MKLAHWLILGGAVAALVLSWLLWGGIFTGVPVEAARVSEGPIPEFVDEQAKTRLPETYLVTMPLSGRIEAIALLEGTPVSKGKEVARIVPGDLKLETDQATAVLHRLEAAVEESADVTVEQTGLKQAIQFVISMDETVKAAAERVNSARDKFQYTSGYFDRIQRSAGARSADEIEAARLQMAQAGYEKNQEEFIYAAVRAMQAATNLMPTMVREYIARKGLSTDVLRKQRIEAQVRLQQAQRDQQRGSMTSPVDGVVLKRLVSNEQFLAAGTSLLEIGRLEDLEVEAEILTLDVVAVKEGDRVDIYGPAIGGSPARGTMAHGTVVRIYPAGFTKISSLGVEQQRVMVIIRFAPEDLKRMLAERRLGVGYRVRVRIFTAERTDALLVPRSALFRATNGDWQVYAVRNGRARLQKVEVGLMNDERVEITSGLAKGELVVLAPESTLTDGARVKAEVPQP